MVPDCGREQRQRLTEPKSHYGQRVEASWVTDDVEHRTENGGHDHNGSSNATSPLRDEPGPH